MAAKPASVLRIPPQNIEGEKALLGSIMLRQDAIFEVLDQVQPRSFYVAKHSIVFDVMMDLHSKKEPIDLVSLSSRLTERGQLESIGGRAYLAELLSAVPSSTNIKHYADIIHKKFVLRNLISASDHISELGFNEEAEVESLLDSAEKKIFEVSSLTAGSQFIRIKDSLAEAWDRLDKLHKGTGATRGVPTGYKELDNLLSGFQKTDLIILAARPSVGKTTFALDIARKAACEHNVSVAIFSLEMSNQQLIDRMLAAESRVNAWKLRTGQLKDDNDFMRIQMALDKLAKAPIFIDDQATRTVVQMKSTARRIKREHGLDLIVIDYLQLITTPRSYDSMVHQVTEISRSLKTMAKELDVPVIALSQLSRAIEQRRDKPRLSDLRDSGSIEQDADVVMFIHREDKYRDDSEKTNVAEILVEKHRNGPVGKIELYFEEKNSTFVSLEKDETLGNEAFANSIQKNDVF